MRKKSRTKRSIGRREREIDYADRFYRGHNRNKPLDIEDEFKYEERSYRSDYENPLGAEEYHGYAKRRNEDGVWNMKYGNPHGRGQFEKGYHGEDYPYGGRITHSEFGHQGNRGYYDQDIFEERERYSDRYADYDRNADEDYGYDEFEDQFLSDRDRRYRTEGYAEYEDQYYSKLRRNERERNDRKLREKGRNSSVSNRGRTTRRRRRSTQ